MKLGKKVIEKLRKEVNEKSWDRYVKWLIYQKIFKRTPFSKTGMN